MAKINYEYIAYSDAISWHDTFSLFRGGYVAGKTAEEATRAFLAELVRMHKKAMDVCVRLEGGLTLRREEMCHLPKWIPEGYGLVALRHIGQYDGDDHPDYGRRFFAVRRGEVLHSFVTYADQNKELVVGNEPVECVHLGPPESCYKLPAGSLRFTGVAWRPCEVARMPFGR